GNRLSPYGFRRSRSAQHHHELYVPLQRQRSFPRRPVSGNRRQPLHHVLHHGDRERQVRVRMDRRPGIFRDRIRLDLRRMTLSGAIAVALLIAGSAFAAEIPPADRRSGYDFMKPHTRALQDEDTTNPGMLWVLDAEAL